MIDWTRKLYLNVHEANTKIEDIGRRVREIKLDKMTEDFVTKTKKKLAHLEDCSRRGFFVLMGLKKKPMKHGGKVIAS